MIPSENVVVKNSCPMVKNTKIAAYYFKFSRQPQLFVTSKAVEYELSFYDFHSDLRRLKLHPGANNCNNVLRCLKFHHRAHIEFFYDPNAISVFTLIPAAAGCVCSVQH